ncbi:MAG: triose-phosphate isomerase [Gammaproteobacteria bacterium]|jgi:triosephosphate isomerase
MRRPMVAGNWKMHGKLKGAVDLARAVAKAAPDAVDTVVFPPFVHLRAVIDAVTGTTLEVGAQDIHYASDGAFTGAISASMVKDVGASYVLVGHSERRAIFGETNAMVAAKFELALAEGLTPIVCVGESLEERERGEAKSVVLGQLEAVIGRVAADGLARGMVAYEPVWAIGTGRTATPEQAQEMHAIIREAVARHDRTTSTELRVLYGGSVKADNARSLFREPDVDGGLVGGASLEAEQFVEILSAACAGDPGS